MSFNSHTIKKNITEESTSGGTVAGGGGLGGPNDLVLPFGLDKKQVSSKTNDYIKTNEKKPLPKLTQPTTLATLRRQVKL